MEINLETGLPELPEGLFWRVSANWEWNRFGDYAVVEIIEKKVLKAQKQVPFWGAFGVHRTVLTKVEAKHVSQLLWKPGLSVLPDSQDYVLDENGDRRPSVHSDEVTPELILLAAQKAFGRYETKIASDKLFGDYPPKKLTIEEKN